MNKEKIITSICLTILFLMLCGIIPHKIYTAKHVEESDIVEADWEKLYPFRDKNSEIENKEANNNTTKIENKFDNLYKKYIICVKEIKTKIEKNLNEHALCRTNFIELNGRISKLTNQKYIISGSDKIVNAKDDYLVYLEDKNDMTDEANLLIEFSNYLNKNDIDLLYVQAPNKVNKFDEESLINGYKDYSNNNADNFISKIKIANIDILDLRDEIKKTYSNEEYYKLFFKTDHHWLQTTGIWATKIISNHLNKNHGFNINTKIYDIENYNAEEYKKLMFGSAGRKVTLGYAQPEDFKIYYPKFKTNFHVKVPSIGIEKKGDFYNTLIYQRGLQKYDPYNCKAYWAYGYGDQAIINIDNLNVNKGKKILMIKDSYAETVYPFLAIETNQLEVIDLRDFTGSLKTYINESKPDMVIMMYNPSSLVNKNVYSSAHSNLFDFD